MFIQDFRNAHDMFVDAYVRALINCLLQLLHGLCMLYCLMLILFRIALFHRTNIHKIPLSSVPNIVRGKLSFAVQLLPVGLHNTRMIQINKK